MVSLSKKRCWNIQLCRTTLTNSPFKIRWWKIVRQDITMCNLFHVCSNLIDSLMISHRCQVIWNLPDAVCVFDFPFVASVCIAITQSTWFRHILAKSELLLFRRLSTRGGRWQSDDAGLLFVAGCFYLSESNERQSSVDFIFDLASLTVYFLSHSVIFFPPTEGHMSSSHVAL